MKTRIFRVLVCFVVLCALLISISSIKARAVLTEATILTYGSYLVIFGACAALGVTFQNQAQFDSVHFPSLNLGLRDAGFSVDDLVNVYLNSLYQTTYLSYDLLSTVQDLLYSEEVLSVPYGFHKANSAYTFGNGTLVYPTEDFLSFITSYQDNYGKDCLYEFILVSSNCSVFSSDYSYSYDLKPVKVDDQTFYIYGWNRTGVSDISSAEINFGRVAYSSIPAAVITAYLVGDYFPVAIDGVMLGERVVTPELTEEDIEEVIFIDPRIWELIPDGSDSSGDGSGGDDDTKPIPMFPVTIPSEFDPSFTQDKAQTGKTEGVPDSGGSPGTGADPGENPEGGSSSGGTSGDSGGYALDLTEYFPFCIPFDIYEFLSLLAAEPEAPVFEWVIPVPQMDTEFPISIDLSAWDGVAKLFRTFELLAFIIGLAMVTRDKFIRG